MFIIVGLGNPTKEYEGTRHNVGFEVIDAIADKYNVSKHAIECIKYKKTWKHLTKDIDFYGGSTTNCTQ